VQQKKSVGDQDGTAQLTDQLLLPYLQASDELESHRLLTQLISEDAEPIVSGIISSKLRCSLNRVEEHLRQDADDMLGEVILELLTALHDIKRTPEKKYIRDFRSYVAAITFRVCAEYLRRKNPWRHSLHNKIRYVLTRRPGFALWKDEAQWVCGFASWRDGQETDRIEYRQRQNLRESFGISMPESIDARNMSPTDLLSAIFNWAGRPVNLQDVVSTVADLWGIKDETRQDASMGRGDDPAVDRLVDKRVNVAKEVEQRLYLRTIWEEIGSLSIRQRSALLLNLTDPGGQGVIVLFPTIGIASFRDIADTLGMTVEKLADIWNDLPLEDKVIAEHLGVTRQQVINLRKAARERLARRTKAFATGA
jgi:hypothetical protein